MTVHASLLETNSALIGRNQPAQYLYSVDRRRLEDRLTRQLNHLTQSTHDVIEAEVKSLLHWSRHRMRNANRMNPRTVTFDPDCPFLHQAIGIMRCVRLLRFGALSERSTRFGRTANLRLKTGQKPKTDQDIVVWMLRLMQEVLTEEGFYANVDGQVCQVCYNSRNWTLQPNDTTFNTFDVRMRDEINHANLPISLQALHPANLLTRLGEMGGPADARNNT